MSAQGRAKLYRCLRAVIAAVAATLLFTTAAQAAVLDASWIAPTTNADSTPLTDLASYRVYYSTSATPCPGSTFVQVASATASPAPNTTVSRQLTGLTAGTVYFVSVTAVDTAGNESACLSPAQSAAARVEFSVSPSGTIAFGNVSLGSTADQTVTVQNTAGGTVAGTITAAAPFSVVSGGSFSLAGAGTTHNATIRFTPTLAASVTANLTVSVTGSSVTRVLSGTGLADSTAPTVAITTPTSAATFSTTSASVNLAGTAADNILVTQVTWTNNRGGSGTATGTASWTANNIGLQSGANVITVTARDAANNTGTTTLTVTVTDTTAPTVTITGPTSAATFTTSSATVNLAGTAADNIGVTQVTWTNDRGGSGTATGTTSWTANGVSLQPGTNVLTVTARDGGNNTATATLTVTVTEATAPTVAITSPTAATTFTTSSTSINLAGTAADNVGVTQVTWANSRGGTGTATGTTSWTANGITLQSGINVLTITARDAANNAGTATLTVTVTDTTAPTVAITGPTAAATFNTTAATLNLTGTASDNVGVTQVTWTNSRGGSGTATGTTTWTANNVSLQPGANVLTVTARDAANNTVTATLTVTFTDTTAPTVAITGPTAAATFSTGSATVNLAGTTSDNVAVTQVTWTNSRGGSGTATGTTAWTANGVALQTGANVLTVTARDAANNTVAATLTVTFTDATGPTVSVTAPGAGATVAGTINVTATASDNVGVVGVQFRLDGVNLGAEATTAPYTVSWDTSTATNASHTLTAVARDAAGNSTTTASVVVTVSNVAPPVISAVTASAITSSAASISWTTDTLSDTQVEYGPTTAYGAVSAVVSTLVTAHTQTLSGLAPNTIYQFRVKSRDAGGRLTTSGNFSFTTLPDMNTGLIAYWTFNEGSGSSAADSSGNGNTATLSGATWTSGIVNQAVALDGVSSFVSAAHTSAFNAYPLTIAGWIKTGATTGTRGIVNKYIPGVSANGYRLFMSGGSLCAEYVRSGAAFVSDGTSCPLATAGYADNQWHHVTFTVDALGGRLYVDGVQRASLGWTGTPGASTTSQQVTIGDDGGTGGFFSGSIDDLKIYTRALSSNEVAGLYGAVGGGGVGAPVISGVSVVGLGPSVATISWTTNTASDTQVEYGPTAAYGNTTAVDTARVTSHSRALTGLAPGTVYFFRVRSRDASGNLAVSSGSTFRTPDMPSVKRKSNKNFFDDFLDWLLG
jgi:hypothetical protein